MVYKKIGYRRILRLSFTNLRLSWLFTPQLVYLRFGFLWAKWFFFNLRLGYWGVNFLTAWFFCSLIFISPLLLLLKQSFELTCLMILRTWGISRIPIISFTSSPNFSLFFITTNSFNLHTSNSSDKFNSSTLPPLVLIILRYHLLPMKKKPDPNLPKIKSKPMFIKAWS